MGSAFLCAGLGAAYIGAAYALITLAQLRAILGGHSHRAPFEIVGLVVFYGFCSGAVTGATYGVSGGRLGVILAGTLGGLADPVMLATFHGLLPILGYTTQSPRLALAVASSLGLPFLFSFGFSWLLYRADESDSALPMLTAVARAVSVAGVTALPVFARLGAGFLLGAIGVRLLNSPYVQAFIWRWQH